MVQPVITEDNAWQLDSILFVINSYLHQKVPLVEDRKGLKALQRVYSFLSTEGDLWYFDIEKYRERDGKQYGRKVFKRVLAFPESIFAKIKQFQRVILMSGTLHPPKAYQTLYGLDESYKIVEVPHESRKIKYLMFVYPHLSSRMKDRSVDLFKTQCYLVKELHKLNPNHTLVFSTSRAYTKDLRNVFERMYPEQEVYIEGTSAQNQIILNKLTLKKHELMFTTLAGGFSEGVEIKDRYTEASKITMIVFTGIPHPPPTLAQQLLEYKYMNRYGQLLTTIFLKWLPIYQVLLQAAGRGIRRPTDRCIIISLDNRLPSLSIFPRETSFITDKWERVIAEVKRFYKTT
jgi:Rad3-related DNA helicase